MLSFTTTTTTWEPRLEVLNNGLVLCGPAGVKVSNGNKQHKQNQLAGSALSNSGVYIHSEVYAEYLDICLYVWSVLYMV